MAGVFHPIDPFIKMALYEEKRREKLIIQGAVVLSEEAQRRERLAHMSLLFVPHQLPFAEYHKKIGKLPSVSSWKKLQSNEKINDRDFDDHLRNVIGDLNSVAVEVAYQKMKRQSPNALRDLKVIDQKTIISRSEQYPNPDSRVTLSRVRDSLGMKRVRLDWRFTADDLYSLRRTLEVVGLQMGAYGYGRLKIRVEEKSDGWLAPNDQYRWKGPLGCYHHMGTTRISDNPKNGVVDGNCKVHGLSNLYVGGSSVFPTSGHVPPTLTIVALAHRLADHLKVDI